MPPGKSKNSTHGGTQRSSTRSDTFDGRTDSQPEYDFDSRTCPVEDEGPDEPLPLSAKGSRVGTAIGSWFFAIIWNGITWVVGYFVLKEFNLFPALFLAVFFLIGIAVLLFAIYSTLQIWNPRTIVVCSQRNLYPGSEFEISWLHQGNAASISELSIHLEGSESATYRQGTTTRTDKSIFLKQTIVQTKERTEIDSGFSLARLPEETMHSFESGRNSISWQIQVHGKIRFWPDINDTFAITIYPPKGEGVNDA